MEALDDDVSIDETTHSASGSRSSCRSTIADRGEHLGGLALAVRTYRCVGERRECGASIGPALELHEHECAIVAGFRRELSVGEHLQVLVPRDESLLGIATAKVQLMCAPIRCELGVRTRGFGAWRLGRDARHGW